MRRSPEPEGAVTAEKLAKEIEDALGMSYLRPWLQATILNPRAMRQYWHRDRSLRIEQLTCMTAISELDARVALTFAGRNESMAPSVACPMLMFGGSVIHYTSFPENSASFHADDGPSVPIVCRSVLDIGQLQLVDMMFPAPLRPGAEFEVRQAHVWPTGMAHGEDTLWYPYAAIFERQPRRLLVHASFDRPLKYLVALEAHLAPVDCAIAATQPVDVDGERKNFRWLIEPVDNQLIYGLAFER